MIHRFGLRSGSAGVGEWHGGEGVHRDIEFLEPMQVSILSEVSRPYSIPSLRELRVSFQYLREEQDNLMAWKAVVQVLWEEIHGLKDYARKMGTWTRITKQVLVILILVERQQFLWGRAIGC